MRRVRWSYGSWDSGWWSPFDHRELRDDRVVYSATMLWPGTYTATYLARATTPGTFIKPPAHAEEMYNPGAERAERRWNLRRDAAMIAAKACVGPRSGNRRGCRDVAPLLVFVALPLSPDILAFDATRGVTIEDRHGVVLRNTRADDGSNARWVSYDRIDPDVINAFVAVEDRRFWDHHGVDVACRRSRASATTCARIASSRARRRSRCSSRVWCVRRVATSAAKLVQTVFGTAPRRASQQATDPRAVSQSRRAGAGRGRCRRGERALLRHVAE